LVSNERGLVARSLGIRPGIPPLKSSGAYAVRRGIRVSLFVALVRLAGSMSIPFSRYHVQQSFTHPRSPPERNFMTQGFGQRLLKTNRPGMCRCQFGRDG